MQTHVDLKRASIIYFSLAMTLTFYHAKKIEKPFWVERSKFHQGIINGDFKSPYQYRVVAPWLAEGGGLLVQQALNLTSEKSRAKAREFFYVAERLISTFLLFIFFHLYLRTWFSQEFALSGTLILAGIHLYTYQSYYYQPDSPLHIMFLTLAVYLMRRGEFKGWLYPLTVVGSLTRETFGLIASLHVAHFGFKSERLKHAIGIFTVWLGVQLTLRLIFGFRPSFPSRPLGINLWGLDWVFCLFSLMWLIPLINYGRLPLFLRRAILFFGIPSILANFMFGKAEETRLFLELGLVVIPATMFALFTRHTDDSEAEVPSPKSIVEVGPPPLT